MLSHIVIEAVTPLVDCGRYPAKCIAGAPCVVEADIFRDGHQLLRAAVKWRRKDAEVFDEAPMTVLDNDRWRGEFVPADNARYVFTIEAWTDLFASWLADFAKKVNAGKDAASDLVEGIGLLEGICHRAQGDDLELLSAGLKSLRQAPDLAAALAIVSREEIAQAAARQGERFGRNPLSTASRTDRRSAAGKFRRLVRDVHTFPREPAQRARNIQNCRAAAARSAGYGLRRGLPSAHPSDRSDPSQRTQQYSRWRQ